MSLVPAILEVRVLGDGGSLDLWGPAMIAGAAVIAAGVAARTANNRQREQLAHDRAVRAHEHVRNTIDAAADRAIGALESYTALEVEVEVNEETRARKSDILEADDSTSDEKKAAGEVISRLVATNATAAEKASKTGTEVIAMHARLRLRLGPSDPIVVSLKTMASAFVDLEEKLLEGIDENRDDAQKALATEADKKATKAFHQFMSACEAWFKNEESFLSRSRRLRPRRRD